MTTVEIDGDKLMALVYQTVGEVGATLNAALVVMGDRLGYYRALADAGPSTPAELAERTSTSEHYTREWLNAQAAGGFVEYDPGTGTYLLPPEQTVALTDESSPAFLPGFFQIALGTVQDTHRLIEAARSGAGIGWHEHDTDVHIGCERFFRPGYNANLLSTWLPALDDVVGKLERGARVADIGCGHGASTILMAKAFPNSTFIGSDYHPESIETARLRAAEAGVDIEFQVASATQYGGSGYDLVTTFDALHDMGDPVGAAKHVRESLAPDGTWMVVEPMKPATRWRTTSTLSAACTTASPPCSVLRAASPRTSAWHWAPRPGQPGSATSPLPQASPGSVLRPRPRSTWSSKSGPETVGSKGDVSDVR